MKPIASLIFTLLIATLAHAQKAPVREPGHNKPRQFLTLPLIVPMVLQQLDSTRVKPGHSPVAVQPAGHRQESALLSRQRR